MRKTIVAASLALAAFSVGSEARAAGWGLHSGETLGQGDNMLYGEVGWPDFSAGFQHALSSRADIGFRFSLPYGYDYTTDSQVGMVMRVPIRLALTKSNKFSALFHFDPGLKFESLGDQDPRNHFIYNGGRLAFGFALGVGLEFGFHLSREATINFGFEAPIYLNVTGRAYAAVPLLFGPGFEYQIDNHIALGFNTRFGPTLFAFNGGDHAQFALLAQAYFAYRL
jgi:hypothetical protein